MASVVVTLDITLDGASVFGRGPLVRRYEAPTAATATFEKIADDNATAFSDMPLLVPETVGLICIRASGLVNLRLNGQTDALVPVGGGGLLLLLDTAFDAASPVTINNPAADTARTVSIVYAGT